MKKTANLASAIGKAISMVPAAVIQPEGDALWMIDVGKHPQLGDRIVFEVRLMQTQNFRVFKTSYLAGTNHPLSCTPVSAKDIVLFEDAVKAAIEGVADHFDMKAEERFAALVGMYQQ